MEVSALVEVALTIRPLRRNPDLLGQELYKTAKLGQSQLAVDAYPSFRLAARRPTELPNRGYVAAAISSLRSAAHLHDYVDVREIARQALEAGTLLGVSVVPEYWMYLRLLEYPMVFCRMGQLAIGLAVWRSAVSGSKKESPSRRKLPDVSQDIYERDLESLIEGRLHSLVQAMLAVNDMFVMAQPRVASFFFEDVRAYLDSHDVRYTARVKLAGKSGYDHGVDFLIPKSRQRPERLLQAIAAPKRDNIFGYLWTLSDTRAARGGGSAQESEAYAFLNDQEQAIGGDVIEALHAYRVIPAVWSERDKYVAALAELRCRLRSALS
jgi:Domain of unknown function DUF1829